MRAPSILQPLLPYRPNPSSPFKCADGGYDTPFCFVTCRTDRLDVHHIYPGPNRRASDEHGFWVYLTHDVHMALHDARTPCQGLKRELQELCQAKFEENHTREEFMGIIGRSYL